MSSALSLVSRFAHFVVAIACGVGAVSLLARPGRVPPPLHEQPFRLVERAPEVPGATRRRAAHDDVLRVTPAKPLLLPYVFGDCDFLATVTIPAGGELDLVFRKLDLAEAHGRFSLLRLSADREAPPWRTREQALFAPGDDGGVKVAPGLPASIRIELREALARANVAGRWLAPFTAQDDRGSFAFVVRGGEAEISHLQILPRPSSRVAFWPHAAGALLAIVVALGARGRRVRACAVVGVLPLGAWGLHTWLVREMVAGSVLSAPGIVTLTAALAIFALALARAVSVRRMALFTVQAVLVGAALMEGFARLEATRLIAFEDPRLDLYFGVDSCAAPFDALAKLLHGKNEVHAAEPDLERVVFLGGEPLFEANLDRMHHLGIQATTRASHELRRRLVPAVFPTLYPHTLQQTKLFQLFYADAYPATLVVLGIDRWEAEREGAASARARLRASESGRVPPSSYALALLRRRTDPAVIAPPQELRETLAEFVTFCGERGLPLVLATHGLLAEPHLATVAAFARERGVRLVRNVMTADERADVEPLAAAIVDALRR